MKKRVGMYFVYIIIPTTLVCVLFGPTIPTYLCIFSDAFYICLCYFFMIYIIVRHCFGGFYVI